MRIAVVNLTGGGMSGGYKKYLCNVIPMMAVHPAVEAILCASPNSLDVQDWFGPVDNVKFVNYRSFRFLHPNLDLRLKQELEKFSPDVIFVPVERYFHFNRVPVVIMVQNMEPFVSGIGGNPISERFRNWVRRIDGKRALKKSDRIIAISDFVRDFLIQQWNVPRDKIGLVNYGIELPENKDVKRPAIIPEGWKDRFLFTAGSIRPARGLEDVLYALKILSDKSSNISGLVIAGETTSEMRKYRKSLESWIEMHNLRSRVFWTESLNEKEMAWCYQNSLVFVMTSRVESFGMIAGEAMSQGCICISADNSCLPEIFKDAAVYYPSKDGQSLAKAIKSVFSWDSSQRERMAELARNRASEFSWGVCASKTVAELVKAIKNRRIKNVK